MSTDSVPTDRPPATRQRGRCVAGLLAVVALATGCNTYNHRLSATLGAYQEHRMADAAAAASREAQRAPYRDKLPFLLEKATTQCAAGQYKESAATFATAQELVEEHDEKAKVSIGRETAALLTNLTTLPYEGTDADRIMLNSYRALACFQAGDAEGARVALRQAYQRQQDAVANNAKRIEKAQEQTEKAKEKKYDVEKAKEDPRFQGAISSQYGDLDRYAVYTDYVNPYCEFLQGLSALSPSADGSDRERAAKSFERLHGMMPGNRYLTADAELSQRLASGVPTPPLTYIIYEAGLAPELKSIRIDIPVVILGPYSGGVDYVGAAFPKLEMQPALPPAIRVRGGETEHTVELLCDMDAVIARQFKTDLPLIITKTLVAAGTKAALGYAANESTKRNFWVNVTARLGAVVYQIAMNQADLRTWRTLPKQYQYCRLETPADRRLVIQGGAGQSEVPVTLVDGQINVVHVKCVAPGKPLLVSQFVIP